MNPWRGANTVPHKREGQYLLLWYFHILHPLILDGRISMKGNEFTCEIRVTLSHRFHKDRAAVVYDIQQRMDSFTPTGWSGLFG